MYVEIPTRDELAELLAVHEPGCVSIYVPTTPISQRAARGDRIAFKNLADEAVELLRAGPAKGAGADAIAQRLGDLVDDYDFWSLQARSLVVLMTAGRTWLYRLPSVLSASVTVGDRLAVKPLLRAVTFPHAAYVLALAQGSCRVLELAPDGPPEELDVAELPRDQESAVGRSHVEDPSQMTHLQGGEGDKVRMRQYARRVDGALRGVVAGGRLPLILAAAEPLASIFRAVCTYPGLADAGIAGSPGERSDDDLAQAARAILDGLYAQQIDELRARVQASAAHGRGTVDLAEAARAATYGVIDTLLVDIDADQRGTVDPETGAVTLSDDGEAVTEEIVRRTLATGGRVLAVRADELPGAGPVAALLRHPLVALAGT